MGVIQKLGEFTKKLSKPVIDTVAVRNRSKNIIGFYGVTDNSGTTSLLMNIAEYLQEPGNPVVVVDFVLDCPVCYRYLDIDEVPDDKSLLNKFRTSTLSANELVLGSTNSIGVCTMSGYEHPSDYCDINITTVESLLKELSMHYKYVLVDLGTNLNSEATVAGILACNKVYSVVRPIAHQISKLLATKECIENLGHRNKITDVIQSMILDNAYSQKDFSDTGLRLIGNIAQDADLMRAADNCRYISGITKSKEASKYLKLVKAIGEDIKSIVKNSYTPDGYGVITGSNELTSTTENNNNGEEELS